MDAARLHEHARAHADLAIHDPIRWICSWRLEKRHGDDQTVDPYEVIEGEGNLLMYGGASCLWECLIGNGAGAGGSALSVFSNANAYIGVGDSTTAEAATQTDLQAAANKLRKAVDATYPTHTDGVIAGAATVTFKSTFGTTDANFHWEEWGIFNGAAGGRMLNRKVTDLGTKTAASSWAFTITITLA